MQYVKLQLGCLLVVLYVVIVYLRATVGGKGKCNRFFDALMIVAPQAILFDGVTSWTVNHMDIVPLWLNQILHYVFFIAMDLGIVVSTAYMYDLLIGYRGNRKEKLALGIPTVISLALITVGMGDVDYIKGETTWYSMGFSVYVCFATLIIFYGVMLFLVISRRHFLSKDKIIGTWSFILICGGILLFQIIYPEVLLTSILPTMLLLGIYIDFENPYIRKVDERNDEMIDGFATLVESRDNNTGGHIKRTKAYVKLILKKMRHDKHYRKIVSKDYLTNVSNAAPLHDIGKIETPDSILQKPGKLTDEEYAIMKQHAAAGGEIILRTFKDIENEDFRQIAYEVARYHHEKYNGKGYPEGLKGEEIPLHARIMAIADVFDAVSQKRCYRDAMDIEECFAIIERGKGTDFDPRLAQLFLDAKDDVRDVSFATRSALCHDKE